MGRRPKLNMAGFHHVVFVHRISFAFIILPFYTDIPKPIRDIREHLFTHLIGKPTQQSIESSTRDQLYLGICWVLSLSVCFLSYTVSEARDQ